MIWIVSLFVFGVLLLIAEFFLPGLIAGIMGVVLISASTIMAINAGIAAPGTVIAAEVAATLFCVIIGAIVIVKFDLASGLTLKTTQRAEEGWVNERSDTSLIGRTGTVMTPLRPSGTVQLGSERIDAVSDGAFIETGQLVRVVEVHGNRVVVEQMASPTNTSSLQQV